ncbi:polyphosphate kinase 1 [Mariniblastus fucicola]|uniref:Polyphosphate kinase n=1 Tax=Mariniblastus fucicola TaxID=980251 RepID=A0A5B9PBL5_9BACT|nr:polyphosphate kinase 1 [Mariniblastus fucicola]QEG22605.1 Polyphosphate kinase [Mariniblastus fucicola]
MKKKKNLYLPREASWIEFNKRVLDRAFMESVPLLERVKFLAITASNLDEFMMVRFGGLKMVKRSSSGITDISGLDANEQIKMIRERVRDMQNRQIDCLGELLPKLAECGIRKLGRTELSDIQRDFLRSHFESEIVTSMAPIGVDESHPPAFIRGLRLHVCVRIKDSKESRLIPKDAATSEDSSLYAEADAAKTDSAHRFVIIPLPRNLARVWAVPTSDQYSFMFLEDIIGLFVEDLFPGQEVLDWTTFRVTRNGDVVLADDDGRADLLRGMEEVIEARKMTDCIRLEISSKASKATGRFLQKLLNVEEPDTYRLAGPLALVDLFAIGGLPGFQHLKNEPWPPHGVPEFDRDDDIFATIAQKDRLIHHPYQSYDAVVNFIRAAATDDRVIAIKQTLYRTARDSEIAAALETAVANGKNVTCIVELKARFDEARNIEWAKRLEAAGVDVIYGVRGLKTHAKMCVVIRKEATGIQRYMHLATGNYNESTARVYSDVSFFTCDEQLGRDAVHLFNAITGLSVPQSMGKIAAAPINLRETTLEYIQFETESARQGNAAAIRVKVNSLVDREIIDALYEASQAGVEVRLNVRGLCCLMPGKKGMSENIRVISVVDRFLEHSRIFYFYHGGDEKMFISSADWMGRNLDRRVELLVPIEDRDCKNRLLKILNSYFNDSESATELMSDGSYVPVEPKKKRQIRSQQWLYEEAGQLLKASTNPRTTVFQPHRPG